MKTMTLRCPHGAYDVHTPVDAQKYLLPSVAEEKRNLRDELKTKIERRLVLTEQRKLFTSSALEREYAFLGERIFAMQNRLSELNQQFKQQTHETPESMFKRAAHTLLPKEEFERIHQYAKVMMQEFEEGTHLNAA